MKQIILSVMVLVFCSVGFAAEMTPKLRAVLDKKVEEAQILAAQQKFDEAAEVLRSCIKQDPSSGVVHALLGVILIEAGNKEQARAMLIKASELSWDNHQALWAIGADLLDIRAIEDSIKVLERVIDLSPNAVFPYLATAQAFRYEEEMLMSKMSSLAPKDQTALHQNERRKIIRRITIVYHKQLEYMISFMENSEDNIALADTRRQVEQLLRGFWTDRRNQWGGDIPKEIIARVGALAQGENYKPEKIDELATPSLALILKYAASRALPFDFQ